MTKQEALIIVDAQRCFMPASEGERLDMDGFGELPVEGGEEVVAPLNELTHVFRGLDRPIMTTQDQHPEETAHFSDNPNYVDTWPKHGRAGTPGGELHPDLLVAQHFSIPEKFIKGDVNATSPDEDTSYTGVLAHNPDTGETLPEALRRHKITSLYIGGLALGDGAEHKLCVDDTAIDFLRLGFEVTVVTDAVEAVLPENRAKCLKNMGDLGIKLATTKQVRAELEEAYA